MSCFSFQVALFNLQLQKLVALNALTRFWDKDWNRRSKQYEQRVQCEKRPGERKQSKKKAWNPIPNKG